MFYEQVLHRNGHKAIGTWSVVAGWDKQKSNHRAFKRFEIKKFFIHRLKTFIHKFKTMRSITASNVSLSFLCTCLVRPHFIT